MDKPSYCHQTYLLRTHFAPLIATCPTTQSQATPCQGTLNILCLGLWDASPLQTLPATQACPDFSLFSAYSLPAQPEVFLAPSPLPFWLPSPESISPSKSTESRQRYGPLEVSYPEPLPPAPPPSAPA